MRRERKKEGKRDPSSLRFFICLSSQKGGGKEGGGKNPFVRWGEGIS